MEHMVIAMYSWCICEICHGWEEKGKEINVMLWMKIMGPHACMYVMCIGILPRYVMLVRTCTFSIYVHHDIMQAFPFLWHPVTCNTLCPTKLHPGVRIRAHLVSPWAHAWTVWGSITHPTLPGTVKSPRPLLRF